MKFNFKEAFKNTPKRVYFYSFLAVVLALVTLLVLNYCQFYVHEYGHASAAILSTMTSHNNSVTINFTYIDYKIPLSNISLKVPQQTISRLPKIMMIYGVLFTMVFYALVFMSVAYGLSRIKSLKENNRLAYSLIGVLVLLILNDFISNLFCGTDGLNFSCSPLLFKIITGTFIVLFLLCLGYFYMELLVVNKLSKSSPPLPARGKRALNRTKAK